MRRAAQFYKVSLGQFKNAWENIDMILDSKYSKYDEVYEGIKLPKRATKGSAGYDIYAPTGFLLKAGESLTIPTGLRCYIMEGWVLKIYPRSGWGFKYKLQLNNTVGIIDSDYYFSDNEGHIFIKLTNDSREHRDLTIEAGTAFAQGIFLEYGITMDDGTDGIRNGGFGSTSYLK